jgi:outer membrane receptor protein involved in Fe transport
MAKFASFVVCILLFFPLYTRAQTGNINGKVTDENSNEPLVGATITIIENSASTISELDGAYKLRNVVAGTYTLQVSFVGHDTKKISDVVVAKNDVTTVNIVLPPSSNTLNTVTVTTTSARQENFNSLLVMRRNASVVSDGISADMIRKSPDKNTSDVLKRISGTSVQDNKYVVVRGMNDRYNEAMLNGIILPSSESDRKTFSFDIFPSEVVDNITIYKSAEPDLPGSFAGGLVQVNTKEVPERKFIALKANLGSNSMTMSNDFYTYPGSKTDWLGYDNTVRPLPGDVTKIKTQDFNNITDNDPEQKKMIDRTFVNDWAVYARSAKPLNASFQLTGGFNANLSKHSSYPKLGGIFGVTYNSSFTYTQQQRTYISTPGEPVSDTAFKFNDSNYTQNILESALANFSFRINANNRIYINNIFSINSFDQTILRGGYNNSINITDMKAYSYDFVSNKIYNGQVGGEHYLNKSKIKVNWFAYYTDLEREEPDNRYVLYNRQDPSSPYYAVVAQGGTLSTLSSGLRYYNSIKDVSKGGNVDVSFPFQLFSNKQSFKTGGAYYDNTRDVSVRYFNTNAPFDNFDNSLLFQPIDKIFDSSHFDPNTGFFYAEPSFNYLGYNGYIKNTSLYAMFDNRFTKNLRLVWGVRLEKYRNELEGLDQEYKHTTLTNIKKDDWLPSANFIYAVLPKANLRLSYSKTVTRPVYRELSPTIFYDFVLNATYSGNPGLVPTYIDNYELRWEHFFSNAQYYSVSFFYKQLQHTIEPVVLNSGPDSYTITYSNIPSNAKNKGIELEARKDFGFISKGLENLVLYANASFIKSEVDTVGIYGSTKTTRPLFGQSPYLVNASLQYTHPKTGIGISVLFNKAGARLWLLDQYYNKMVYELPRPILDIKLTKTFLKKGIAEFSWGDLLHQNAIFFHDVNNNFKYDKGTDAVTIERKFGYTISFGLGYKF